MKHHWKRLTALALTLCLCVAPMPTQALSVPNKIGIDIGAHAQEEADGSYTVTYEAQLTVSDQFAIVAAQAASAQPEVLKQLRFTCTLTDPLVAQMNNGTLSGADFSFNGADVYELVSAGKSGSSITVVYKLIDRVVEGWKREPVSVAKVAVQKTLTMTSTKAATGAQVRAAQSAAGGTIRTAAEVTITRVDGSRIPFVDAVSMDAASGSGAVRVEAYVAPPVQPGVGSDEQPGLIVDTSSASGWAVNWVNEANGLNLLSERTNKSFTANVTRLQFADLTVRMAEQITGTTITPADVNFYTDTTEEMILKAKTAGIATGYQDPTTGDFSFRPNNPISREEICVMLAHVVEYVESGKGTVSGWNRSQTIPTRFPDRNKVSSWAVAQVAQMTNNSIMSGKTVTDGVPAIDPGASTSLEEAITLVVKLCNRIK